MKISKDGENWYEVSDEQFRALLRDESQDYLVDLSKPKEQFFFQTTTKAMRQMEKTDPQKNDWNGMPKTLFGLPVVIVE